MIPTPLKWIASILFGLFVGRASYGFIHPALFSVFGFATGAADGTVAAPNTTDYVLIGASILSLLTAIAVAAFLLRSTTLYQLFGRGFIPLGISLLLGLLAAVLMMDTGALRGEGGNDGRVALFFWSLIFGLPMLISGLGLTIGGWVLLRKARKTPRTN
ncbi:hypothetical protein [Bordetella genomosp. 4]|uniref:hypothetical protein n=1 Tax=Bordetella genomosp. 4 TaxID=463044 RepID=UPI0020CD698C|nr:hypothetical protein [Bordetella genomosp. 4]